MIDETYKKIASEKKKYNKLIKKEIIKERNNLFDNAKKEVKKDKNSESLDLENIQLSLNLEFEGKAMSSQIH